MRSFLIILASLLLAGCGSAVDESMVSVAIIGDSDEIVEEGVRLSPAAQHLRLATNEGLVTLDSSGQVIPAIAQRWIVNDDGLSYIFRLRESNWLDGEEISAADIRVLLNDRLRQLEGTSLGLDLAKIAEVRAMTGRVIEIRLSSPMPEFLRVLAQPELGFAKDGSGAGPMVLSREEQGNRAGLSPLPPELRGFAPLEDWEEFAKIVRVQALPDDAAVDAFSQGEVDVVLNGRLTNFPIAQLGPLSQGNVRLDPTFGLFGFSIANASGFLEEPARREALSMAIDREALTAPFALGGWQSTTWIVPAALNEDADDDLGRWPELSRQELRAIAANRVAEWEAASGEEAVLRVSMPSGEGSDLLFRQLFADWADIGVRAVRAAPDEKADLVLRDRLARYSSPRWFLNQLNCSVRLGLCSEEADELVRQSLSIRDPAQKTEILMEAHSRLVEEEVFIPLGAPVRWSLVRGSVSAFDANRWGFHPLFPLSQPTI